ncbi:MAG TPA: LytTR family DNA-binding domain-containing protein [Gemmatimonadaceae bacterium]|jgi:two-component system LytT family response regulator|nr:LytTR family DNA-binding domain-containing protein [Gemmatimonadaceae bacterium]
MARAEPDGARAVVRAVVVDDEPTAREVVTTLLAEHPTVQVVGEASNGNEAVALVRRLKPDLLFLDIQMPDQDGFRVLDALGGDVPRGIVFVTAHDEHAIRAFDVHALDYVLKPFGRPRFRAAVTRALEGLRAMDALTLHRTLASMAADRLADDRPPAELSLTESDGEPKGQATPPRRIGVRNGSKITLVEIDAIDWVEASGDYARIHAGKQRHLVAQRMHALERLLEAREFVRVHRSLIVNVKRIRELHREPDGGGTIVLADGVRLRVARGRWESMERALSMEEF